MDENERQQLFDYAALGREVDSFWNSHMGQYLLKRSDDEYIKAMEELKTCDPTDSRQIMRLQGEARRAESFRGWLSEAIQTGLIAENQLEDRDDETSLDL